MEYCPIGDIRSNPQMLEGPGRKNRLFKHVALALKYLHERALIHGNLKPQNILMDQETGDHRFRLADFGLRVWNKKTNANCPAPLYLAPEIANPKKVEDSAKPKNDKVSANPEKKQVSDDILFTDSVDIYSLGVVLLEVHGYLNSLQGRTPPVAQCHAKIEQAIGTTPHPSTLSEHTDELFEHLRSMVQKNPDNRPDVWECLYFLGVGYD